eukprot:TRINITY_DN13131_c0_g1_i1.p1 TRINITY_DN13131_c0_g1~~TRINITY_DN13131_c0_g1_i1.p1  ORF type:complete len:144 (-),score=26.61 TRINITY_DN13131_c0_g1_i1:179-610(-)
MKMNYFVCVLLLSCYLFYSINCVESRVFNLKPDAPDTVTVSSGGVSCSFSYSTHGGSSENWEILLEGNEDTFACFIGRPNSYSYLYFNNFKVEITGSNIQNIEIQDNHSPLISGKDYEMSNNIVSSTDEFKGTVSVFQIFGSK